MCHHYCMACSEVTDREALFQKRRVDSNILNKKSRKVDKGCFSSLKTNNRLL
jgi:hypothetical protein